MAATPPEEPQPKKDENGFKEKLASSLDSIKKNEKFEDLYGFARNNTRDTIAYILMIIGIVLLLFHPFYGGLLIGLLGGFYFASEIVHLFQNAAHVIDDYGLVRSLMAGGVVVGFFICAPAIFIGIAIAVALKQIIFPEEKRNS